MIKTNPMARNLARLGRPVVLTGSLGLLAPSALGCGDKDVKAVLDSECKVDYTVGCGGTDDFDAIQSALNAAAQKLVSPSEKACIKVCDSTYQENLTIPPGKYLLESINNPNSPVESGGASSIYDASLGTKPVISVPDGSALEMINFNISYPFDSGSLTALRIEKGGEAVIRYSGLQAYFLDDSHPENGTMITNKGRLELYDSLVLVGTADAPLIDSRGDDDHLFMSGVHIVPAPGTQGASLIYLEGGRSVIEGGLIYTDGWFPNWPENIPVILLSGSLLHKGELEIKDVAMKSAVPGDIKSFVCVQSDPGGNGLNCYPLEKTGKNSFSCSAETSLCQ